MNLAPYVNALGRCASFLCLFSSTGFQQKEEGSKAGFPILVGLVIKDSWLRELPSSWMRHEIFMAHQAVQVTYLWQAPWYYELHSRHGFRLPGCRLLYWTVLKQTGWRPNQFQNLHHHLQAKNLLTCKGFALETDYLQAHYDNQILLVAEAPFFRMFNFQVNSEGKMPFDWNFSAYKGVKDPYS